MYGKSRVVSIRGAYKAIGVFANSLEGGLHLGVISLQSFTICVPGNHDRT